MRLASVKSGDIVQCDRGGVRFFAEVDRIDVGGLHIQPLDARHTWRYVKARAVVGHWSRRSR